MKKLRISCALYNVFLQVTRGIHNPYTYSAGQNKANNADTTQTHGHPSSDASTRQHWRVHASDDTSSRERFFFCYAALQLCFVCIVMLNKINSQVWGSPIIPCLNKRMKDINRDKFGNMGSTSYAFIRQKSTSHFWRLENKSLHFNKQ